MEIIVAAIFTIMVVLILLRAIFSDDRAALFSPVVFICIYFTYYLIYPFLSTLNEASYETRKDILMLFGGAIINLIGILMGFRARFSMHPMTSNNMYTESNAKFLGIGLSLIGFFCYAIFNGFTFDIISIQKEYYDATMHRMEQSEAYLTMLISLFPAAACLFYAGKTNKAFNIALFIVATIIGITNGSRYKLLMFYFPFFIFYHLYPEPKRINYKLWGPVAIAFVITMGIIEKTRNYRSGLDQEALMELRENGFTEIEASEGESVYRFSAQVMEAYQDHPPMLLDVVGTALFLPIPRTLFPEKPDAQYLRDANIFVLGTDAYGAAWCNITEAYLAFGWLGIFINGLLLGILSRYFWLNYKENPSSVGAVMYLALFDAICYVLISRGYLAQEYLVFMYYMPIIYLISKFVLIFRQQEN